MTKRKIVFISLIFAVYVLIMFILYKPQYFFDESEKIDIISVVRSDDFDNNRTFISTVIYQKDSEHQNSFDVSLLEQELYTLRCSSHPREFTKPYSYHQLSYEVTLQYNGETYLLIFTDNDVNFVLSDAYGRSIIDILNGDSWLDFISALDQNAAA